MRPCACLDAPFYLCVCLFYLCFSRLNACACVSLHLFDQWILQSGYTSRENTGPAQLCFRSSVITTTTGCVASPTAFPDTWQHTDACLALDEIGQTGASTSRGQEDELRKGDEESWISLEPHCSSYCKQAAKALGLLLIYSAVVGFTDLLCFFPLTCFLCCVLVADCLCELEREGERGREGTKCKRRQLFNWQQDPCLWHSTGATVSAA